MAKHRTNKAHICSLVGDVFLKDARIVELNKRQSLLEAYNVTFCSCTRRAITEKDVTFQTREQFNKIPKFFIMTSEFRERFVMLDEVGSRRTREMMFSARSVEQHCSTRK